MVSTDNNAEQPEVLRWYTPARRLQRLVGKAPGGGYYPGGPYPITAIFGAGVVLLVLTLTKDLIWSTGDWLTDSVLIPGVSALVVLFALKKVKPGGRNPLSAGWAFCSAVTSPSYGRYRGRALRSGRPRRVRHRINAELTGVVLAAQPVGARLEAQPEVQIEPAASRPEPARQAPEQAPKKARPRRRLQVRPALRTAPTVTGPSSATSAPTPDRAPALSSIQRRLAEAGERRAS